MCHTQHRSQCTSCGLDEALEKKMFIRNTKYGEKLLRLLLKISIWGEYVEFRVCVITEHITYMRT